MALLPPFRITWKLDDGLVGVVTARNYFNSNNNKDIYNTQKTYPTKGVPTALKSFFKWRVLSCVFIWS